MKPRLFPTIIFLLLLLFFLPVPALAAEKKCETKKEAAAYLRDQMLQREQTITFLIKASEIEDINNDIEEIRDLAYAYDRSIPEAGDYLALVANCVPKDSSTEKEDNYVWYQMYATYATTKEQEDFMKSEISKRIKSLNLSGKTGFARTWTIYDYMAKTVTYSGNKQGDADGLYDTPYTVLNYKALGLRNPQCRCRGFAGLLYRMLLEAGIDCRIIKGTVPVQSGGEDKHCWNTVKYGGVWFSCDVTEDSHHPEEPICFMVPGSSSSNDSFSSFKSYKRDEEYTKGFYSTHPMSTKRVISPGLSIKMKKKVISYRTLKKKKITVNPIKSLSCMTSVTFKPLNLKANKGLRINRSSGRITVRKKTGKGLYRLKVKIIAKPKYGYKKVVLEKVIKIRVR